MRSQCVRKASSSWVQYRRPWAHEQGESPMQHPAFETALAGGTSVKAGLDRRWFILDLIGVLMLLLGYGLAFGQVSAYEAGIVRQTFTVSGAIPVPVIYL